MGEFDRKDRGGSLFFFKLKYISRWKWKMDENQDFYILTNEQDASYDLFEG